MSTVGLVSVKQYNKSYCRIIKELGHKSILFDIYADDALKSINQLDKKVDLYFWQSIDRGVFYRQKILDPVYFIEKYSRRKIFPDFNQVFTFNDKVKQWHIFQALGVPTPAVFYAENKEKALHFISNCSYPFVLKDPHSSSGLAVYLIKTKKQARDAIHEIFSNKGFHGLQGKFYAQKFIPGLERSMRVIVIGHKTYCAYWRVSSGDWKHHVGPQSTVTDKNIPKRATRLCEDISKKLGYHWMAYDILVQGKTPYVIEFSCNFGVAGARALGYEPWKEIMKYAVRHR
ncbi:ATP-grasp domain-containing protein [Patescibacteria group bacterium]|nr:ATP-grasp domain-containing protein [Patescibacteria group bacterium]MBU1921876.1 ATP-grasp domain-containing protein [Patescibacteria group bacterium]